jgi:hypothetical protein
MPAEQDNPNPERNGIFYKDVLDWIRENPSEFTVDGKPDRGNKTDDELRYRPRILKRCKQYDSAPDEYLNSMMKTFPELIKWYFNLFQTVFVATLVGVSVTAFAFAYKNFFDWISTISSLPISLESFLSSFSTLITWVLPSLILAIVLFLALKTNKKTGSSWLSYILQHKFRIIHNLTELKIETYYVAKVIENRANEKTKQMALAETKKEKSE